MSSKGKSARCSLNRLPFSVCEPLYDALKIEFTKPQREVAIHANRFPIIGGGERGGKTIISAAVLLPHVYLLPTIRREQFYDANGKLLFDENNDKPRNPHFVIFGPTYAEPRQEFQALENWLRQLGMVAAGINRPSKPQDGPWRLVTKHGVVVQTWSMEDPSSIRSVDLEGAVIAECGKVSQDASQRVEGRVSAKRGFIIRSGTMEHSEQWYQDALLEGVRPNPRDLVSYSLPTYSNHHEFPGGRNDPEILRLERIYPDDIFAMRVLAEPRPPRTRVLKEALPAHIKKMKVPDDATIELWIDPGYQSAYAVLFVAVWMEFSKPPVGSKDPPTPLGKRFYVFDELYEQGLTTEDMIALCKRHKTWPRINDGIIDIAGKGHRDAGESALEVWKKRTRLHWNFKYWRESPLIERIRSSFKNDTVFIHPKCHGLIAECGLGEPVFDEMHPWKYGTDRSGRILSEKPIDKWNHSAKALGYGLLHHLGVVETLRRATSVNRLKPKSKPISAGSYFTRRSRRSVL